MYHKHIQAAYVSILIILAIILQRKQTEETQGYGWAHCTTVTVFVKSTVRRPKLDFSLLPKPNL